AVLSVLKKAEDEDALILRVYNPSESEVINDTVTFASEVTSWKETQLDEKVLPNEVDTASFGTLKPCQVKSFQVKF
ncbi:glycosyl hydrolase-related protein, partial [Vibrio owensii]